MTNSPQPTKTVSAVFVTTDKNGKPRFNSYARGCLWPLSRKVAEASFAAGATVYRKQNGVSIWAEGSYEVIG